MLMGALEARAKSFVLDNFTLDHAGLNSLATKVVATTSGEEEVRDGYVTAIIGDVRAAAICLPHYPVDRHRHAPSLVREDCALKPDTRQ
jgi:hypothetical protein